MPRKKICKTHNSAETVLSTDAQNGLDDGDPVLQDPAPQKTRKPKAPTDSASVQPNTAPKASSTTQAQLISAPQVDTAPMTNVLAPKTRKRKSPTDLALKSSSAPQALSNLAPQVDTTPVADIAVPKMRKRKASTDSAPVQPNATLKANSATQAQPNLAPQIDSAPKTRRRKSPTDLALKSSSAPQALSNSAPQVDTTPVADIAAPKMRKRKPPTDSAPVQPNATLKASSATQAQPNLAPQIDSAPKTRRRKAPTDSALVQSSLAPQINSTAAPLVHSNSAPAPNNKREKRNRAKKTDDPSADEVDKQGPAKSKPVTDVVETKKVVKTKTLLIKGCAPVDNECSIKSHSHVYYEQNDIYDCMLNQTNVGQNNNKFYLIQLLEDDVTKNYNVWQRWGRVGFTGQSNLVSCSTLDEAKKVFCKKFQEKTKNEWSLRKNFVKVTGKYDLIKVDYSESSKKDAEKLDKNEQEQSVEPKEEVTCSLNQRVQQLLQLICDVKAMENAVKEMKYDANKAPLGKLTVGQIRAGYEALKKVETLLDQGSNDQRALIEACSEFYTRIPHCFGMRTPPLIRDKIMLKEKMDLLETLSDIEVAIRVLKNESQDKTIHPLDRHYSAMKCRLEPLPRDSEEFKIVEKYLHNTHASTHTSYTTKLLDVFVCEKDGEPDKFAKDLGNRMLLWHGSRLTNWYGILSQGLRIAPPEAPVTGYMFGKGVYFADCSSKSTNYCFATKSKNVGLTVLSEVALGKTNDLYHANYDANKLPPNCNSTKGLGRVVPDQKEYIEKDGYVIPLGRPKEVTNREEARKYMLNYNEYIVYDTRQIRMRYLLKIEFVFP